MLNDCLTGRITEGYRKGTMMTVKQMGDLLGLKKTERYWLLHKNVFESKNIHGKTMVDVASFEKWYAGQIHYRKVTGEEPGELINAVTYSIHDISEILGISASRVYALIKREQLETVAVDFRMRVPREVFDQWYSSQSHYRKANNSFHLADIERTAVYSKEPVARELLCVLNSEQKTVFKDYYNISPEVELTLENVALSRKWLRQNNETDNERTAGYILKDFRDGKIGKFILDTLED